MNVAVLISNLYFLMVVDRHSLYSADNQCARAAHTKCTRNGQTFNTIIINLGLQIALFCLTSLKSNKSYRVASENALKVGV